MTLLSRVRFSYIYLYIEASDSWLNTRSMQVLSSEKSREAVQSRCIWAFKARECDREWFLRRTTENLVACATIWSLTGPYQNEKSSEDIPKSSPKQTKNKHSALSLYPSDAWLEELRSHQCGPDLSHVFQTWIETGEKCRKKIIKPFSTWTRKALAVKSFSWRSMAV